MVKIIKLIETSIDVVNPIKAYSAPETYLMEILSNKFDGKCYAGCLIERVIRIHKRGFCMVDKFGDPNIATVHVVFEAEVIIYNPGEVIHGCTIKSKDLKTGIIALTKGTTVNIMTMDPHRIFEKLVKDQLVSVVVGSSKYKINYSKITINSTIMLFPVTTRVYAVGADDVIEQTIIEQWKKEKTRIEELAKTDVVKKLLPFYESILSAYKPDNKKPISGGGDIVSIEDIIEGKVDSTNKFICRDPRFPVGSNKLLLLSNKTMGGESLKYHEYSQEIANGKAMAIIDSINYYRILREYLEIYNTAEIIAKHKSLWELYKSKQI